MRQKVFAAIEAKDIEAAFRAGFKYAKECDQPLEMVIRARKDRRTIDQNSLSHQWYNDISLWDGSTPMEAKAYCKYQFGMSILAESEPEYVQKIRGIMIKLTYEERLIVMEKMQVTSFMNKKQLTEYLDQMTIHYASQGLVLTTPAEETYSDYPEA